MGGFGFGVVGLNKRGGCCARWLVLVFRIWGSVVFPGGRGGSSVCSGRVFWFLGGSFPKEQICGTKG